MFKFLKIIKSIMVEDFKWGEVDLSELSKVALNSDILEVIRYLSFRTGVSEESLVDGIIRNSDYMCNCLNEMKSLNTLLVKKLESIDY